MRRRLFLSLHRLFVQGIVVLLSKVPTTMRSYLRKSAQRSNAKFKKYGIVNSVYQGPVFTATGWELLRAAVVFFANAVAAQHLVFPQSNRDLSIFSDFPILDLQLLPKVKSMMSECVQFSKSAPRAKRLSTPLPRRLAPMSLHHAAALPPSAPHQQLLPLIPSLTRLLKTKTTMQHTRLHPSLEFIATVPISLRRLKSLPRRHRRRRATAAAPDRGRPV
jgi:hypothetical protein